MNQQLVVKDVNHISAYDPFRAQLVELKELNDKAVFDYRNPKGNKEARSHIYKLRQTKTAVDKARKAEKEASLNYSRLVDSQAKEIIGEIQSMIEVHETPIKQIEQEEKERVEHHESNIRVLKSYLKPELANEDSKELDRVLRGLKDTKEPDERYQEFMAEAVTIYKQAVEYLTGLHEAALKRETEQAELERLRKEKEERERQEREERIAAEARAKAEAEAKAREEAAEKAAKEDAERREQEHQAALAKTERERQEAIESAERGKCEAAEREKQAREKAKHDAEEAARKERERIEAEQKAIEAEKQARAAKKSHQRKINNEALSSIMSHALMDEQTARKLIELIAKGEIVNISINY